MLTMFFQMAYNLTDLIWIGALGSGAVAAIGAAGFFIWMGMAISFLTKVGIEVNVAQSVGKNDNYALNHYIINGLFLTILIGLVYSTSIIYLAPTLIGLFNLTPDATLYDTSANGVIYIRIVCMSMPFAFMNVSFTSIYNGLGKSNLPFVYNSAGLFLNIILDPLLIYGLWIFPRLEVAGAGIATVISQSTVFVLFVISLNKNFNFLDQMKNIYVIKKEYFSKIIKIGLPPATQSVMFALIAIIITRFISRWGSIPIAVQKVGSQIEAISWMTASGFSTALSAFVGQNHGACIKKRVWKGYLIAISMMGTVGIFTSLLLILFPEQLFRIFIREEEAIRQGVIYLTILGYSQLFMCLEITTAGAFNGLGKSMPPSIVGIVFNFLRIPSAILLSSMIGLKGIWWSISGSSILKGIVLVVWFVYYYKKSYEKMKMEEILRS
jgi:putative MATE family efflux protein